MEAPAEIDPWRVANTPEVFHLAMPPNPDAIVSDEALSGVAGGATTSTASTIPSRIGMASSLGHDAQLARGHQGRL